jgi:hypothetical protein
MTTDLKNQIHDLMERGVLPVTAAEAVSRAGRRPVPFPVRSIRRHRTVTVAAGLTAAAGAVALVVTQAGGVARPASRPPAIVTDSYVRHLATASAVALAQSGRAVIVRRTQGGPTPGTDTDEISFSGRNWNDSFSEALAAQGGLPPTRESAINRVVDGQAYDYFVADHGLAWYHEVGPDAIESMAIPDPRTLLAELSPEARFAVAGYSTVGGIRLVHLRATRLTGLPAIQLGNATPPGRLTSLDIWADGNGVVRRMSLTTSQVISVGMLNPGQLPKGAHAGPASRLAKIAAIRRWLAKELTARRRRHPIEIKVGSGKSGMTTQIQRTSMVVTFLDIGQPQVITVPAHAYLTYGLG